MTIKSVDEVSRKKGVNFLLYGANGVGKTPWLAQAGPRCLILDADGGTASAAGTGAKVWDANGEWDWGIMDDVYEFLRHEDHGFDWVWLDSIPIAQEKMLEAIMVDLNAIKSHRDIWAPDKGEYQQNMVRLKQWVRHMSALPVNFGMTTHPAISYDEVEEEERVMPWVQGKQMIPAICSYMDIIGYMEVVRQNDKDHTVIRTKSYNNIYARDRFGVTNGRMVDKTILDLEKMIADKLQGGNNRITAKKASTRPAKKAASKKASAKRTN